MPETKTLEPKPVSIDLDSHKEVIRKMKLAQDANRDEMLRCCNPSYSSAKELAKHVFKWKVTCTLHEPTVKKEKDRFDFTEDSEEDRFTPRQIEGTVVAQNEGDAWSVFCDRIRAWPSKRYAKPKITKISAAIDPLKLASKKVTTATAEGQR